MKTAFYLALPAFLVFCSPSRAYDDFSEERSPSRFILNGTDDTRLVLKGDLRLAWRDLEGPGGPRLDSTTDTATLGTRSPHFALESARMAVRVELPKAFAVYTAFAFTDVSAQLESGWLDYHHRAGHWEIHGELGLNAPFVADDPQTTRRPMSELVYWGQSEAHITTEASYNLRTISLSLGLSAAMMRPLASTSINQAAQRRGTIGLLSYTKARPFSGNAPIIGGKLALSWDAGSVETFGFRGALASEGGIDELRNRIAGFTLLPGYDGADPHRQDSTAWWTGARFTWHPLGFRLRLEGVRSRESLIYRNILSAQFGYVWEMNPGSIPRTLEARVRAERYRIEGAGAALSDTRSLRSPDPSQGISWDYDVLTCAFATRLYARLLWARLEHTLIGENNASLDLGRKNTPIKNNETVLSLELRF